MSKIKYALRANNLQKIVENPSETYKSAIMKCHVPNPNIPTTLAQQDNHKDKQ
jgi:hypothetical protein